ncbi:hypothetical protein ABBQ38_015124, partial [Trebouxia sp. C0009 RCD-2024]
EATSPTVGGKHAGCCQARQAPSLTQAVRPEKHQGGLTHQDVLSHKSQAQSQPLMGSQKRFPEAWSKPQYQD